MNSFSWDIINNIWKNWNLTTDIIGPMSYTMSYILRPSLLHSFYIMVTISGSGKGLWSGKYWQTPLGRGMVTSVNGSERKSLEWTPPYDIDPLWSCKLSKEVIYWTAKLIISFYLAAASIWDLPVAMPNQFHFFATS